MKRSTFSEEQIVYAMRQAEFCTPVGDLCRQRVPAYRDLDVSIPAWVALVHDFSASIVWRVITSRWVIRFLLAWRSIWQSPAR